MVKFERSYVFDRPSGKASLNDLFEGHHQLIVCHFMFDPTWDMGCSGCTALVNSLGDLSLLDKRDTTFAVVSRAPLAKLEGNKAEKDGTSHAFPRLSSDFQVRLSSGA
jgi:predicted dithiol-disulfide oxidoreductase (DUF899 family)